MDFNTCESPDSQNTFGEGSIPYIINLRQEVLNNTHFFATRWSTRTIQFAHMSVPVGVETGLDVYYNSTLFFYIEQGEALVIMGFCEECLDIQTHVYAGHAIIIPTGTWNNVVNTGNSDLKMYAIYSPALHSYNVVFRTKEEWTFHNGS